MTELIVYGAGVCAIAATIGVWCGVTGRPFRDVVFYGDGILLMVIVMWPLFGMIVVPLAIVFGTPYAVGCAATSLARRLCHRRTVPKAAALEGDDAT